MRLIYSLLQTPTSPAGATGSEQPLSNGALLILVALVIIAIAILAGLLMRIGLGSRTLAKDERSWLDYGNLYVVSWGIAAVVVGFLVILLFLDRFGDATEALGFATALFGAVVGLVGTYFGAKQSADAREGAEKVAVAASGGGTAPTVTITPADATTGAGGNHAVTATVISVDGSPAAGVPVNFTVAAGPDANLTGTVTTDVAGQASFTIVNINGNGTDIVEAVSLGGKGTARVTFQ